MRMRNAPLKAFAMDGDKKKKDAPMDLTRKKTIPMVASVKKNKKNNSVPLSPGYEDPVKIQKVQREGLTPNSQKFSKIAKKNAANKKRISNEQDNKELDRHEDAMGY